MENLTVFPILKDVLNTQFQNLCTSTATKHFLQEKNCCFTPSVLISSNSTFLSRFIARKHLSTIFDKQVMNGSIIEKEGYFDGVKTGMTYISYKTHIEIDVDNFTIDKSHIIEFIQDIISKPSIHKYKHVLLIHSIHHLPSNVSKALLSILDKYQDNVYFIFTIKGLHPNLVSFKNFCLYINGNIDCEKSFRLLLTSIKHPKKNDEEFIKCMLNKSNNDIVSLSFLLELDTPELFIGYLGKTIENFLDDIIISYSCQKMIDLEPKVRDFCVKMSAACVDIPIIVKKILNYIVIRYPDKMQIVSQLSATMEHNIAICNKDLFAFELYIYEILTILHSKP